MELAAFLPASIAVTTTSGPVTQSPPANTPGRAVSSVSGIGTERSRFRGRQPQPFPQGVHVGNLANRDDDRIAGNDELRAGDRLAELAGRWRRAGRASFSGTQGRPRARPRPGLERLGRGQEHQLDAFALRVLDLATVGGHFGPRAPVDDRYLGRSAAQGRARRVESGVAAAHHQHAAGPALAGLPGCTARAGTPRRR